ncbi:alkaline phosphatase family protein [soil metagenome]
MKKLCFLILSVIVPTLTFAQNITPPKLVVGIVVDQMRPDYIARYWNKFGTLGFKRMLKEGFECRNTNYNYVPTYTGPGHASIYTGTTPSVHGIVGNDWFQRNDNDTVYCAEDKNAKTVGADNESGMMSPHRLLTTTITDELQLSTRNKSKVIGISLKDRGAIMPAGRAADAAFWFDSFSGNWITSSWYMNALPQWVQDFNARKWPQTYLSQKWETVFPISTYTESDADSTPYESPYTGEKSPVFPHDFPAIKTTNYELVRRSPFGNTMTKDLALAAIAGEEMGKDSVTDFLCVSFSATDYVGHQFGTNAIETEDTYIRLDRDLADLFQYLDKQIGKGKYLVFLTADHAVAPNPQSFKDQQLEGGFFSTTTIGDSTKNFLKKNFGKAEYFQCFMNEQIYLNHALIEKDSLDLCIVEQKLAMYLANSTTGISDVITACNLQQQEYTQSFRNKIQKGYSIQRSGDLSLLFDPAWIPGNYGTRGTTHGSPYTYDTHVPLLWMGWNIPAGNTTHEISITDIAPTLSFLLNISLPNGCTGHPIPELVH